MASAEVGRHHYPFSTDAKLRNACRSAPVPGHTAGQKRAGKVTGACGFTGCSVYEERLHCKENMKFIDAEIIALAKDGITVSYISAIHSKPAWLLNSSRFQGYIFLCRVNLKYVWSHSSPVRVFTDSASF